MENNIEILNDLVQINNDRIKGYKTAIEDLDAKDADLKILFEEFISQSQKLKTSLQNEVNLLGGESEDGTTASGNIYRAWMDVKAMFTGDNRQTALNNCETGEDAAQKAYKTALEDDDLSVTHRDLITSQKLELRNAHDQVKALRDQNKI